MKSKLGVWDLYEHNIFFSSVKGSFSNPEGKVEQAWTLEGEQVQTYILALAVWPLTSYQTSLIITALTGNVSLSTHSSDPLLGLRPQELQAIYIDVLISIIALQRRGRQNSRWTSKPFLLVLQTFLVGAETGTNCVLSPSLGIAYGSPDTPVCKHKC